MRIRDSPSLWNVGAAIAITFGGRLVGLAWVGVLTSAYGVNGLGLYSTAFASAAIGVAGIDSAFLTRSIRVDDPTFNDDQAKRGFLAGTIAIPALALFAVGDSTFLIAFAVALTAGEIAANQVKAPSRRNGRVQKEMALDFVRQTTSIAAAIIGWASGATFEVALSLYVCGYLPFLVVAFTFALRKLPRCGLRMPVREFCQLNMSSVLGAVYLQGDLVLLGVLVDPELVGAYALATLIAINLTVPSQLYANSGIEKVREGVFAAAVWWIGIGGSAIATAISVALIGYGQEQVGYMLLLLVPAVFARSVSWWLTLQLAAWRDDRYRLYSTAAGVGLRFGILSGLVFVTGESVAFALAASVAELMLMALYLRRRRQLVLAS